MGKEGGDRWRGKVAEQSVDEEDEEVNIYLFSLITYCQMQTHTRMLMYVRKAFAVFFFFIFRW